MRTSSADKAPQGPTLEEAAARMEGLLELREANQGLTKPTAEEAPAEDDEGVAETEAKETTADDAKVEEAEVKAADADEDTEATDVQEPQMVTVRIDGK